MARLIGALVREERAINRIRAPSNSRTFDFILVAMNARTSSGRLMPSSFALWSRIAILVSRSGAWMSAINPHSNRERKRSTSPGISLGGQSLEITICLPISYRALKV